VDIQKGTIFKILGGFYFVDTPYGKYRGYIRGKLKREVEVLVGDWVKVKILGKDNAVIEEILPRKNRLIRPAIANVDQCIVVISLTAPPPNLYLLDRFLIHIQAAGLQAVICCNKIDLVSGEKVEEIENIYQQADFTVVATSAKKGDGIASLHQMLQGKTSVVAGPSGVGKSSILNRIQPGFSLQVGEISPRLGRGRHTTRHVELLSLPTGGRVADTPGFTTLDLVGIARRDLPHYYPEFVMWSSQCRFPGCLHWREPDCAVKKAVARGQIDSGRYNHYLDFLQELEG
jgi:ribosome biogenesis GTPase